MRTYKAKIKIPDNLLNKSTGDIGQQIFELWYKKNYEDELLFEQLKDRDYEQIDYADWKGFTYQVKATKEKTYTFNCQIDKLHNHANADFFVFIQLKNNFAFIENIYEKEYILNNTIPSYKYDNCFVWAKDLQQEKLEL